MKIRGSVAITIDDVAYEQAFLQAQENDTIWQATPNLTALYAAILNEDFIKIHKLCEKSGHTLRHVETESYVGGESAGKKIFYDVKFAIEPVAGNDN